MPLKTFHYDLALPADPARQVFCAQCVEAKLAGRPGIHAVRIATPDGHAPAPHPARIELDYDPQVLTLGQIKRYAQLAGGCLHDPTHDPAHHDHQTHTPPPLPRAQPASHPRVTPLFHDALRQPDLLLAIAGGLLLILGVAVEPLGAPYYLHVSLLIASAVVGGWTTAVDVFHVLRKFKFDIDVLMFAAAFGAASLGHFEEGALLLFLFGLGGALESLAMNRARRAIEALAHLAPEVATVVNEQGEKQVPVAELRVGDRVRVKPGERVAADGVVRDGHSAIDQSPITGESIPVEKVRGDEVFAGTINGSGVLTIEVGKLASENTLAKVIRMVEEAQASKSPTQLFTQKIEHYYVPAVLIATAALIVLPPLLGLHPRREGSLWAGWFYQAMAFLTAASPCALAIGTPAAVLSGIARSARAGVLIKGGAYLENLGRIDAIAFDKTGTLTYGRPEVTDVIPLYPSISEDELLAIVAAVERGSQHPLAEAISNEAEIRNCPALTAESIQQTPGIGITGVVGGRKVWIGKHSALKDGAAGLDAAREKLARLESQGRTTMAVMFDGKLAGVIGLADRPREGAEEMIRSLKALGVRHTIMLTGDNARTAAAVAERVGIDEHLADLMPEDKLKLVRELDEKYGHVAMVGDGVNDAPAMANASVGIAIGGASGRASDAALETADVALLSDDLLKLPEAIGISRFTRRIILQNLVIALGVIAVLAPLAASGHTSLAGAVVFHEGSTVVVVMNALRILGWKR